MTTYIIRRVSLLIPTMLVVTIVVFLSVRFIPGDIIDTMISQMGSSGSVSRIDRQYLEKALGLDAPIYVQYVRWLGVIPQEDGQFRGILQGSLGKSLWKGQDITQIIVQRLPVSLELAVIALLTALLTAIPIGAYSAIRQDTFGDYFGRSISILFLSVPAFWIGTMIMVYPAIWWRWSPALEYIPLSRDILGNLLQFLLPGFILGMVLGGTLMRITRTMMLEVLRQDYIRTAWAKGLSEETVIRRHALKNALIPVVTVIGIVVPLVIGGTVVIEQIFALPGLGLLMFEALTFRDYPVISGINLFLASLVILSNLAVDLTYAWLDPRIQYK
jgi:peptide/nickel transport system permease protein